MTEEIDAGSLDELSARCGIQHGYHDIGGAYHQASPTTRRNVLAGMGLKIEGNADVEHALSSVFRTGAGLDRSEQALRNLAWDCTLPPLSEASLHSGRSHR